MNINKVIEPESLVLVDAGARGGLYSLGILNPFITAYGFEPHAGSFHALRHRPENREYKKVSLFQAGLSDKPGKAIFNISVNASYNSLLEPDLDNYSRHMGLMSEYAGWERQISTIEKTSIETLTLDQFCKSEKLPRIDFLKLDTQGSEMRILQGATELIRNGKIGVLFMEVSFVGVYQNQPLFSDLDQFLRRNGFQFVDCLFYPDANDRRWTFKNPSPMPGIHEDSRCCSGGDAIYFFDPGRPESLDPGDKSPIFTALVLGRLGYFSLSRHLLKTYSAYSDETIQHLLFHLHADSKRKKIKRFMKSLFPPLLLSLLKAIKR